MGTSTKARILLVDDEPALLVSSRLILEQNGYEAVTAASSAEARLYLQQDHFDLLLSDLGLERPLSGIELVQWARQQYPGMVCILVTGSADDGLREELRCDGVQVLFKPVQVPKLLQTLETLLQKS